VQLIFIDVDLVPIYVFHCTDGGTMGNQVRCTVRSGGKRNTGTALLETNEIIFRGDVRLKIPLTSLRSVSSRDGELRLEWNDGEAVFEIGTYADKWAHQILHPKSVGEKLGVKPGLTISAIAMKHSGFVEDLRRQAERFSDSKALQESGLIFFGAESKEDLARAKRLAQPLSSAGALWIVYPKGRQEIKEQHVLEAGRQAGLVDVKVVSFSATHTALKFVRPKAKRPPHPSTRRA
jgi:hypothetical protein